MYCFARRLTAFTLVTLAVFWPAFASASLRAVSDEALARASAAAVHGRVTGTVSAWDADVDTIYTYVTLDVLRAWGLDGTPARVVVKQLGGAVGETAFVVGGQSRFEIGEEVLVFLDVRPRDGTLSVAGLEQGKWLMTGLADPTVGAAREMRGHDPSTVVARDYRALTDLEALAALAGTRMTAAGAVLTPAIPPAAPDAGRGHGGAAFTLLSSTPARWQQADTATPVYVDTQTGGHPQFAGGGLQQLVNAAGLWRAAGSLPLLGGTARTPRCFTNSEPSDGRISVTYGDPCGEIADGSSTLAIGGAYFTSAGQRVVNGVNYWSMVKGMIITDNVPSKYSWMSTGCYEDMLAHELGHAIGFGHAAARPAMMFPSIASECTSRSAAMPLQADDLAGMASVYPGGSVPPPSAPATPTAFGSTVSGSTVTITWTPASSGSAATAYQIQAGSAPGAADYGAANVGGTSIVVPGVPNGTYYIRILALNAQGASAPTADRVVVVGPALPGAPQNLTASVGAGGLVTIAWQAPASGGAPASYVILAGHTPGSSVYQVPVGGSPVSGVVPSGTYYVRVAALNGAGPGPVSSEVVLVVP